MLLNLLNNSAQAMDKPRGVISITTRPLPDAAVAIDVEDNGKGIAPEALPRIFDPFYTTKDNQGGTGLGLAVCSGIVKEHDGWIDVEDAPNGGSVFRIYVPA